MILLICIFAIAFCVAWVIVGVINMILDLERDTDVPAEPPPKPFSVSEYLDRMERAHKSIIEKRENEEPYTLILWWGLDGLRLNADGTMEWIDRKPKAVPIAFAPLTNEINMSMLNDTTWTRQANCSREAQIDALKSKLQVLEYQAWLIQQIQNDISKIQPARDLTGKFVR